MGRTEGMGRTEPVVDGTRGIIHRARSKKQGLKINAARALPPGPHAI